MKPPTAEEIFEQAKIDGTRLKEQPVAYYRDLAKVWQRHIRSWWYLIVTIVAVALLINTRWLTAFYVLLGFWIGMQYRYCKGMRQAALAKAWETENEQTLNAMREGGLLDSPRDLLVVMRDADPPPGTSRKDWVAQHDDLIKRWDAEHG